MSGGRTIASLLAGLWTVRGAPDANLTASQLLDTASRVSTRADGGTVRPYLKPGLRRVWRDDATLQFGLDPDRAVLVTDLEPPIARFIENLTGATDLQDTLVRAEADGVDGDTAANVLQVLAEAGVLDDADADSGPLRSLTPIERERLAPDLVARALISTEPGTGLRALRVRRNATVRVTSSSRVGSAVATLLASSGVGHLVLTDQRPAVGTDIGPAGLRASDVGHPRSQGMRRILTELAPSTRLTQRTTRRPDLVVIASDDEPDRAAAIELVRDGIPHLVVGVRETVGVVGPFVIPGSTACLHCLDLHRTDLDPAWPALLAQAASADCADSGEVNLSTLVASLAVLHVLSYLDGGEPSSVNGTLSAGLPDARIRRRSWLPHQQCGCTWESLARPDDPPETTDA